MPGRVSPRRAKIERTHNGHSEHVTTRMTIITTTRCLSIVAGSPPDRCCGLSTPGGVKMASGGRGGVVAGAGRPSPAASRTKGHTVSPAWLTPYRPGTLRSASNLWQCGQAPTPRTVQATTARAALRRGHSRHIPQAKRSHGQATARIAGAAFGRPDDQRAAWRRASVCRVRWVVVCRILNRAAAPSVGPEGQRHLPVARPIVADWRRR